MSSIPDVTGTDEGMGKGRTPKGPGFCTVVLGHGMNSSMTVIWIKDKKMGRYRVMVLWLRNQLVGDKNQGMIRTGSWPVTCRNEKPAHLSRLF